MILRADIPKLIDLEVYIPRLREWFWDVMHEIFRAPPSQGYGILMGAPLWGADFIDRFFHFCLPSILAPQNLEVLKGNCRLVIFTDTDGWDRFWSMQQDIMSRGIDVQLFLIPQDIMDQVPKKDLNKYWLLGTVQQMMIQMAGRAGMGFHALHPDHLYSEAYFKNLYRLADKYEGLAATGISADIAPCLEEMEKWRQPNGSLAIPDRDLGDMGFRHLHKQMMHNIMNGVDFKENSFPLSHYIFWKGRDKLYLFCCHMNAVYLSPERCRKAPIRLHNALDTELPYYMPNEVGIIQDDDGMTFIELSDEKKLNNTTRAPFGHFAAQCWSTVHFKDDYQPFFGMPNTVPIHPQEDYMEEDEIKAAHGAIFNALVKCKDEIKAKVEEINVEREKQLAALSAQGLAPPAEDLSIRVDTLTLERAAD